MYVPSWHPGEEFQKIFIILDDQVVIGRHPVACADRSYQAIERVPVKKYLEYYESVMRETRCNLAGKSASK